MTTRPKAVLVTGIHTGVGKTLVAASLTLATSGAYWKPIQTGPKEEHDEQAVGAWLTNTDTVVCPTRFSFSLPASPNIASANENTEILVPEITLPEVFHRTLVIEGVGGFLVPLNSSTLWGDWAASLKIPVVVVVGGYLGCINHTLLTVEAVQKRSSAPLFLVFCGDFSHEVQQTIIHFSGLPIVGNIPYLENPNPMKVIQNQWITPVDSWLT